jgi:hypothetical protein
LASLRKQTKKTIDYLALMETRVDLCAVKKIQIKWGFKSTITPYTYVRMEVSWSYPDLNPKLIPDSVRTANTAGHIGAGVFEAANTLTIIAWIYQTLIPETEPHCRYWRTASDCA